jgi:hypothetical protein
VSVELDSVVFFETLDFTLDHGPPDIEILGDFTD